MKKLFSCLFGSSLYGTKTPTSDRDVKHIVLPDLDDLLIGKKIVNVFKKTNTVKNKKNTADDVDEEFIPLQVFANDFMMGQTYALELAFSIDGDHAEQTHYWPDGSKMNDPHSEIKFCRDHNVPTLFDFVMELREKFLTSNIKAMMGYVVKQASLYSFKGERLNASKDFLEALQAGLVIGLTGNMSIEEVLEYEASVRAGSGSTDYKSLTSQTNLMVEKHPKYFKKTEYDIGGNRMRPCFSLLEKTIPHTMKLQHAIEVVSKLIDRYGSRAEAAAETNVDWKATMHAIRIVDEGLNLLNNKRLSFPFDQDYVDLLLSIKGGKIPLDTVTEKLNLKLDKLKELEKTTDLPEYNQAMQDDFNAWLASWMKKFYYINYDS